MYKTCIESEMKLDIAYINLSRLYSNFVRRIGCKVLWLQGDG